MSFKVLQVIPKLGYGGTEVGCYDLAHYLAEQGCKSYIVTSGGELLKFVRKDKVKIIRLPVGSKNPILILFNAIIILLLLILLNINIVHARSRAPAWSCYLACLITRKKFVTTFHGFHSFPNKYKKFYNSIMLRSDLTIAGSNFMFEHIHDNYSEYLSARKKLLVIFRGINLEYFDKNNVTAEKSNLIKKKWGIEEGKFVLLLPGRLTAWKGQEVFIEALNILVEDYANLNFQAIILGSDQGRTVYTKKLIGLIQRYRLNKRVKFVGGFREMPVAYSVADIVISSSIKPETFGRIAVEAQAMEKPIIASNIGGSKETIKNSVSGILYKYDDPRELAKALNSMIQNGKEAMQQMGLQGRDNVLAKFNVDKMCEKTFSEYKKLLNIKE